MGIYEKASRDAVNKIAIIMATYRGEKYIKQQLQSICNQTVSDWELFIFDDRSDDKTFALAGEVDDKRIHRICNAKNLGATQNFLTALEFVYRMDTFRYFMFSDQDDIWMPDKMEKTYVRMLEEEKNTSVVLVHTDLRLVDESAEKTSANSFRVSAHLWHMEDCVFERLLAQPFVFGCTVMMNRALVEKILPIPQKVYAHDSWVSLIAAAWGKVSYIRDATIYYRKHRGNLSGAAAASSFINRLKRITIGWREQIEITNRRIAQSRVLLSYITGSPYEEELKEYCDSCTKGGFAAIRTSLRLGVLRQGFFANLSYFITLFFTGRKKHDSIA